MSRRLLPLGLLPVAFLAAVASGVATPAPQVARADAVLAATAAYQGGQASDAFSAIHHAGFGRIIAGKRTSSASTRSVGLSAGQLNDLTGSANIRSVNADVLARCDARRGRAVRLGRTCRNVDPLPEHH